MKYGIMDEFKILAAGDITPCYKLLGMSQGQVKIGLGKAFFSSLFFFLGGGNITDVLAGWPT